MWHKIKTNMYSINNTTTLSKNTWLGLGNIITWLGLEKRSLLGLKCIINTIKTITSWYMYMQLPSWPLEIEYSPDKLSISERMTVCLCCQSEAFRALKECFYLVAQLEERRRDYKKQVIGTNKQNHVPFELLIYKLNTFLSEVFDFFLDVSFPILN